MWANKILAQGKTWKIMRACIILHNMIVDDERDTYARNFAQLSSYNNVANGISQLELLDDTFCNALKIT